MRRFFWAVCRLKMPGPGVSSRFRGKKREHSTVLTQSGLWRAETV